MEHHFHLNDRKPMGPKRPANGELSSFPVLKKYAPPVIAPPQMRPPMNPQRGMNTSMKSDVVYYGDPQNAQRRTQQLHQNMAWTRSSDVAPPQDQSASPADFSENDFVDVTTISPAKQWNDRQTYASDSKVLSFNIDCLSSKEPGEFRVLGKLYSTTEYTLSKDEILRRIKVPECMNSNAIRALLRVGKTRSCGTELRRRLGGVGISIDRKKRMKRPTSHFSKLTEGESLDAARDLDAIVNSTDYPTEEIAESMSIAGSPSEVNQRKNMMADVCQFMDEMLALFNNVNVPLSEMSPRPHNRVLESYNDGMKNASALTHGFVIPNQMTWAVQFQKIAKQAIEILNRQQLQSYSISPI